MRAFTILSLSVGISLASANLNSANAERIETAQLKQSKANFKNPVSKRKVRIRKASTYSKARRALKRTKKSSLRRRSPKHVIKHTRTRRYHGLHPRLSRLLAVVKRHYGRPVIVSSGCRSHRHNRRVGGAKRSMHLRCMAADFKVSGVSKSSLRRYVSRLPGRGGVGTYCGRSIVHLDVGPRRSWYHGCRKRRSKRRS